MGIAVMALIFAYVRIGWGWQNDFFLTCDILTLFSALSLDQRPTNLYSVMKNGKSHKFETVVAPICFDWNAGDRILSTLSSFSFRSPFDGLKARRDQFAQRRDGVHTWLLPASLGNGAIFARARRWSAAKRVQADLKPAQEVSGPLAF